jgi:hypothetical protein
MNKPSKQELDDFLANVKTDTDFSAYARLLQAKWRKKKGYPIGKSKNGTIYGNYVEKKFAKETGCNFLTEKIWMIAKNEMNKAKNTRAFYDEERMIDNLLSSQPLCFNVFGEFLDRKEVLLKILNDLKPNLMDKINDIKFEYSPGRGDKRYTGDGTAFDAFIEYEKNNEKCFLGIEVKYAEFPERKDAAERNFNNHPEYRTITENCGLFQPGIIDGIKKPPFSQIWRDHLLSISLKNGEGKLYNNGYFVLLYPSNNSEWSFAMKNYMNFLKNPETSLFELHIEDIIKSIKKHINEHWSNDLFDRYINGL